MTRRLCFVAILLFVTPAARLVAQSSGDFQRRETPRINWNGRDVPLRLNLLSINPLGVVFEYFSGEFEHATTRATSLAIGASYTSPFDISYTSVDLIGRYYPAEQGLRGFSIGPTLGYTSVSDDYSCFATCSTSKSNAVTAGIQLDYSWILGPSQHFGIELGLGAKRLFYQGERGRGSDALPTGRLSVGYAF